jgi:hypothetical protein
MECFNDVTQERDRFAGSIAQPRIIQPLMSSLAYAGMRNAPVEMFLC